MKIAFTANDTSLAAPLDPRFGRAKRFVIYDDETKDLTAVENTQNLNAAQGAGIQSALTLVKHEVDVVITGNCGPKAYSVLDGGDVSVYLCDAKTIADAYDLFKAGKLEKSNASNVEGHWA